MRLLPLRFALSASLFLLFPFASVGQSKPAADKVMVSVKDEFAGEAILIERSDALFVMKADGTGYKQKTVVAKIQSEAALKVLGVIGLPFASASEHVEFHYARSRHADGTVTETPLTGVMEQPAAVTREAPFYSDLKETQLPMKNLKVGDTLEWEARVVRTRAEAPGQFWGQESFSDDGAVVKEESIELHVPETEAVIVWSNPSAKAPKKSIVGGETIYRWESSQLEPTTGPAAELAKKLKKTKLLTADEEFDEEQGKLPDTAWTTFKSWAEVGAWYRGLEANRAVPDDEIKAKVAEIVAGKTTEEEKVRAVYAYVSTQIRYIGVAFGIGRYQPHEAADVLHNQYGDCKDKEMLLASMLALLGVETDAALIGADVRFNDAVPSPGAFNHLITHTHVGGKVVWLDSTEEIAPYQAMIFPLRDKPALVVPEKGEAKIEKTLPTLPFDSLEVWTAKGALDKDGVSESHISLTLRGDNELLYRAAVAQISPAQYDEAAKNVIRALGLGGTPSNANFSRPQDTAEPFTFSFDYHRDRGDDWKYLRLLPQLSPAGLPQINDKEPPVRSIVLGVPHTEEAHAEMKIPVGWKAELPEAVHQKTPFATFDLTYKFERGTVYVDRKIVVLERKVPASNWRAYKKFQDATRIANEDYVTFATGGSGAESAPKRSSNEGGADKGTSTDALIQQAIDSVKDKDKAMGLLNKAEKIDPHAPRLWSTRAYIANMYGAPREAEDDIRKEIAAHPEDGLQNYPILAAAQQMRHESSELAETLRLWIAVDPDNYKPQYALMEILYKEKKYKEAATVGAKAYALMGEDLASRPQAQLALGRTQLKAGMIAEGTATLTPLLKTTDDVEMKNDVAYELADAKQELALDDEKMHEVLQSLNDETASWTLNESQGTLRAKTSLLWASWDTYGWVLFREGKTAEAESYVEAAWMNSSRLEEKGHMDAVRTALGKPAKAEEHGSGRDGQESRTVPLGASATKAFAEYKILLSSAGVDRVEPVGDHVVDGAEAMIRKATFPKLFPTGSPAKIVRVGMVNCINGKCDLILEP